MDRVCVNCGRGFRQHFGSDNINFCNYNAYALYRDKGVTTHITLFLDSSKRGTENGEECPEVKDPNILFKRKKYNV
jgi:hypothetical protein